MYSTPAHVLLLFIAMIVMTLIYVTKNGFSKLTFLFLVFSLSASAWGLSSGTISEIHYIDELITKVAFASAPIIAYSSYLLLTYVSFENLKGRGVKILGVLTFISVFFSITNLVAKDTLYDPKIGDLIVVEGPLYTIITTLIAFIAFATVVKGVKVYRQKTGEERVRVRWVSASLVFLLVGAYLIAIVVPIIVGNSNYANMIIVPLFLSVVSVDFALSRHKYFDLGLASTVAAAYASATLVVFAYIALSVAVIFRIIEFNFTLPFNALLGIVLITATSSMLFYWINRLARSYLSRAFHQSNYDSEAELRHISELLVTKDSITKMINSVSQVLVKDLGVDDISIVLVNKEHKKPLLYDFSGQELPGLPTDQITKKADSLEPITNTTIMDKKHASEAAQYFYRRGIGLILRMRAEEETIGYMLISHRRRRSIFTVNDERFVGLVADQLAIAVSNAKRHDEIRRFNSTLKHKIHQATKDLTETNTKLKALDINKDEFISMASHQLRTPLTSVKGYISMLLDGDLGEIPNGQKKALAQALDSSQRMVYIISDLLNASRLQVGKFYTERSKANLADIVKSEIERLHNRAREKKITVKTDIPKRFPDDVFDENKTRHVVVNFLDNAIYYTPPGGTINVQLKTDNKSLVVKVTDSGIGVPKNEQAGLFTKFYRASNAKKVRPDGTGLGLYLAEKIITSQGGEIIFETTENKGSTFGFKLPKGEYKLKK